MRDLRGQVAVVTGGARRLGRSMARAFAQAGCHMAITYRRSEDDGRGGWARSDVQVLV